MSNARLNPTSADDITWPKGFRKRLAKFAEPTDTTPPFPFEGKGQDRTFSTEFLAYCQTTGLSLDWVYFGDPMPLIMGAHRSATKAPENKIDPNNRAWQVQCLLRCAMLAEENDTSGLDWKGTATVLAVAEELMDEVADALDFATRREAKNEQAA